MRYSMVWPADVDGLRAGTLVHADLTRGMAVEETSELDSIDGPVSVDGAQLRAAVLGVIVDGPTMADFGQGRWCAVLGGVTSSSAIACLDAGDRSWSYRLYSRTGGQRPHLTRWRKAGVIRTRELLDLAGHPAELTVAATERALKQTVTEGLPDLLPLRAALPADPVETRSPAGGRFEVDRGVLTTKPATLAIYAVHPLGQWPGGYNYEQSGQ